MRFRRTTLTGARFPIGAQIRLRDGRYAVVVGYNATNPFRPAVVIAFDREKQPIPRSRLTEPVPLGVEDGLRAASYRGEDMAFMYGKPPDTQAPSVRRLNTLLDASFP